MLYDPYGSSENGAIALEPDSNFNFKPCECESVKNGVIFTQGDSCIVLDWNQLEQLYSILKHNR